MQIHTLVVFKTETSLRVIVFNDRKSLNKCINKNKEIYLILPGISLMYMMGRKLDSKDNETIIIMGLIINPHAGRRMI